MKNYKADTTASAVILSDVGRFDGNELKFKRHIRIKILSKSGLDWGNWSFNTPTKGDFKVVVYNLVNGEIIKDKADAKNTFNEEVINKYEIYKVFAPNVKVGSVIDIMYSHFGMPYEWRFQERVPVVYSELVIENSGYFVYSKTFFGFEPIQSVSPYEWRAYNMPAFKNEPFLNNYNNYITKFTIQLESAKIPGNRYYMPYYYEPSTNWIKIIENLLEHPRFGGMLKELPFLNDFAKEIKKKDLPVEVNIKEAFNFIQSNIKWNRRKSVIATKEVRTNFLTNHSGNSAEINLCLIALLNKMGITTYPVVLSTRDNGLLVKHTPTIDKLNYVVAFVQHDGVEMFLDATSESIAPGILPLYCLNGQGLLVKKNNEQWLELNRNHRNIKKQFVTITIDNKTTAKALVTQQHSDYGFLDWIENHEEYNDDHAVLKNIVQKKNPGLSILSYEISKKDKKASFLSEEMELDLTDQLIDAGNEILINPFVLFEYADNPFKSDERRYPIDLYCPKELSSTIIINIPKEFKVAKLPESIKFTNPEGSASFTYLTNFNSILNSLQFKALLKFEKHIFTESEYKELKQFFSEVIKIVSTPIEISKK